MLFETELTRVITVAGQQMMHIGKRSSLLIYTEDKILHVEISSL